MFFILPVQEKSLPHICNKLLNKNEYGHREIEPTYFLVHFASSESNRFWKSVRLRSKGNLSEKLFSFLYITVSSICNSLGKEIIFQKPSKKPHCPPFRIEMSQISFLPFTFLMFWKNCKDHFLMKKYSLWHFSIFCLFGVQ